MLGPGDGEVLLGFWPGKREVTPSLTLVPRTDDVVEEATDEPPKDSLLLDRGMVERGVCGPTEVLRGALDAENLHTRATGANRPYLSLHSKYFLPATEPSFFPLGSSNSTPDQMPSAKSVFPTKRRMPCFIPVVLLMMTRSPILGSEDGGPEAKEEVDAFLGVAEPTGAGDPAFTGAGEPALAGAGELDLAGEGEEALDGVILRAAVGPEATLPVGVPFALGESDPTGVLVAKISMS